MSTKPISKSTLGLRFMQNALRAKQLQAEVEEDRAPVKDDGQWEVDKVVRDAWGTASSSSSSQTISQESSYLPFLFPSLSEMTEPSSSAKPKGRRVFNKHGQEEILQQKVDPEPTVNSEDTKAASSSRGSKVHPKPKSISRASGATNRTGFPSHVNPNAQSAKQAIFDNAGVGADLHASVSASSTVLQSEGSIKPSTSPNVFLKPAGVDDPSATKPSKVAPSPSVNASTTDADVIPGARSKKVKRVRSSVDQADGETTKRKKNKKTTSQS